MKILSIILIFVLYISEDKNIEKEIKLDKNDEQIINDIFGIQNPSIMNNIKNNLPNIIDHSISTLNDKVQIFGGVNSDGIFINNIYQSLDSSNWERCENEAPFDPRLKPRLVNFDQKLILIGGWDDEKIFSDVWISDKHNACVWNKLDSDFDWLYGPDTMQIEFNNFLQIIHLSINAKVQQTKDLKDFKLLSNLGSNYVRSDYAISTWKDQIIIMGGYDYQAGKFVFYNMKSKDGIEWIKIYNQKNPKGNINPQAIKQNNQMQFISGIQVDEVNYQIEKSTGDLTKFKVVQPFINLFTQRERTAYVLNGKLNFIFTSMLSQSNMIYYLSPEEEVQKQEKEFNQKVRNFYFKYKRVNKK